MKDIYSRERDVINILTSLFSGIILITFIYLLIFTVKDLPFTFTNFFDLHSKSPILFLADAIPLFGVIVYLALLNTFRKKITLIESKLSSEKEKIKIALDYSGNLTHGHLAPFKESVISSNELAQSLNELRETLIVNKESEELRAKDDRKRTWASEGLAMFGEILRLQEENMEDLAYKLISNLVKYLKANQGGFFLIEEESGNKYLQMIACYAYDRKKFADKKIDWGEGLIGTCALEKKTIYLLDIPDQYLTITSGLGRANPTVLIIVPLLVNNEVQGVIELASFTKFDDYQVEFTEKVAESIAMTLSNIKGNLKTSRLLKETQAQAEELAMQEEKVRQNIEELKATQEQAAMQAEKFISFTNSVNHTMIRAEYDKEGFLLYANTKFLRKLGYSGNREVEGRHISLFINEKDRAWFDEIWSNLAGGGKHFEGYMKHITKQGQDLWTMATYTSIRHEDGSVEKILFLAIDTTEHKKQSLDFESQIAALNQLSLKAEFGPDGKLLSTNDLFNNSLKFNERELEKMSIFEFLDTKDIETFNETWEQVITGRPYQGQIKLISKFEEEKWFRASLSAVNDMYGEVAKVVFLANEITNEKIMESESRKQTDQLKQQEEKLRLASVEQNRKMEEKNAEWKKLQAELLSEIEYYRDIIINSSELVLSFDNTGVIHMVNQAATEFWNLPESNAKGQLATEYFKKAPRFPESLLILMDPAKSKNISNPEISLSNSAGNTIKMSIRLTHKEIEGKIIYTLFLKN